MAGVGVDKRNQSRILFPDITPGEKRRGRDTRGQPKTAWVDRQMRQQPALDETACSGEENRKKTLRLCDEKRLRRSNCRVRPAGRDLLSKIAAVLKGQKE